MKKSIIYPIVGRGQKARVRTADGRIVDSWPPNQPLKPGAVQISEEEWQWLRQERIANEQQERREAEATADVERSQRELVMQALGEASMCWSETPAGTFDALRAIAIGERLLVELNGLADATANADADTPTDSPANQDAHGAEVAGAGEAEPAAGEAEPAETAPAPPAPTAPE